MTKVPKPRKARQQKPRPIALGDREGLDLVQKETRHSNRTAVAIFRIAAQRARVLDQDRKRDLAEYLEQLEKKVAPAQRSIPGYVRYVLNEWRAARASSAANRARARWRD